MPGEADSALGQDDPNASVQSTPDHQHVDIHWVDTINGPARQVQWSQEAKIKGIVPILN